MANRRDVDASSIWINRVTSIENMTFGDFNNVQSFFVLMNSDTLEILHFNQVNKMIRWLYVYVEN